MGWIKKLFLADRKLTQIQIKRIDLVEGLLGFLIIGGLLITLIAQQIDFWKFRSLTAEEIAKQVIDCPSATNRSLAWAYQELGINDTIIIYPHTQT